MNSFSLFKDRENTKKSQVLVLFLSISKIFFKMQRNRLYTLELKKYKTNLSFFIEITK